MRRNYDDKIIFDSSDLPLCVFRKKIMHYDKISPCDFGPTHAVDAEEWQNCITYPCPYFDPETYWCKRLGFDRPEGYSNGVFEEESEVNK